MDAIETNKTTDKICNVIMTAAQLRGVDALERLSDEACECVTRTVALVAQLQEELKLLHALVHVGKDVSVPAETEPAKRLMVETWSNMEGVLNRGLNAIGNV